MLDMDVGFVNCDNVKCRTMRACDENILSVSVIDEKLRRQEDEDWRCRQPPKATASFQEVMIDLFISIVQLVEMLYRDSAKTLVGISGECEEWDEDEDDPPLHHAKRSNDVRFTGTRTLNYRKVIRTQRMKKTIKQRRSASDTSPVHPKPKTKRQRCTPSTDHNCTQT
jgi:hypothetical protein